MIPMIVGALWLGAGLVGTRPSGPGADGGADHMTVLRQSEAARDRAGRRADDQVKLALWCEARGLSAERDRHLALAVLSDPANGTARGLMGLVAYNGRWERPETVSDRIKADAVTARTLAEYNARRAALPAKPSARAHFRLATWCE
jgi:hypothetical protein